MGVDSQRTPYGEPEGNVSNMREKESQLRCTIIIKINKSNTLKVPKNEFMTFVEKLPMVYPVKFPTITTPFECTSGL